MANRAVVTWVAFEAPAVPGAVTLVMAQQVLTLSLHAPSISGGGGVIVAPSLQTLALTLHAPIVTTTRSVTVIPAQQLLTLTLHTPTVSLLISVSVSIATAWNVLAAIAKTHTLAWHTRSVVSLTLDSEWGPYRSQADRLTFEFLPTHTRSSEFVHGRR